MGIWSLLHYIPQWFSVKSNRLWVIKVFLQLEICKDNGDSSSDLIVKEIPA